MKTITFCTALVMWALAVALGNAQETEQKQGLEEARQVVVESEKQALKRAVEDINDQLEAGTITEGEADKLKMEVAEKHALNIENKLAIIDNKIALRERNGGEEDEDDSVKINLFSKGEIVNFTFSDSEHKRKYDRRTSSHLTFAVGLNNTLIDGQSLDDSPYKIGGSRFAELGLTWKTRVFKESNWLRLMYGVSFQWNGLKPIDNNYFVDTGSQTELQEFPVKLDKSKFRMDNLVFPVHFEFGPSKKIEKEDYFRYSTHKQLRIGLGGYAGFNLGSRQKLKYSDDGEDVKEKLKASYNTNNFVYGLSGFIGFSDISLYAKYDLNTMFKDNPIEQRNVSLGVRWDWD